MKFLELRGKSLIAVILITSGLDFLLFGCKSSSSISDRPPSNNTKMIKASSAEFWAANASRTHSAIPIPR
jgi:hypothetical protein